METNQGLNSDLAIPPGEYLLEVTEELAMPQSELARRMGRPVQAVSEIVKGHKAITPETALQLEEVVGVPAHIWTGLEADYQLAKAREVFERQIETEAATVNRFPYPEMARMGLVRSTRKSVEKVKELRRFFGVASLENLPEVRSYAPAFRQGGKREASPEALAAWLRAGELEAHRIETKSYSEKQLKAALPELRSLTRREPETFLPRLRELLSDCGVALVLLPHLPKTYANGATFWIKDKAVLMMSLRGSYADIFWFSLFHELGHILLHDKRHVFLEDGAIDPKWQEKEEEANSFACETLIPANAYAEFTSDHNSYSDETVAIFAAKLDIAPGIVTGRLQHDGLLPHTRNMHRIRYQWSDNSA